MNNTEEEVTLTQEPVNDTTEQTVDQNGQNKRDKSNKKGDKNNKDEKKKSKYPPRNLYEQWEKEITVTLETEIPELPKERLSEPNNDDLRSK